MRTSVFVPLSVVVSVTFAIVACRSDADPDCSNGDANCHPVAKVVCDQGKVDCDGTCATLSSDAQHCGACGNACASSFACVDGACLSSPCTPLQTSCVATREDGQLVPACVDTKTDANNCGACGNACVADEGCVEGQCKPLAADGGSH